MTATPIFHTITAIILAISVTTEAGAQVNSWRQQHYPSYYYSYPPSYQHPSYYYQQNHQVAPPVVTPALTPVSRTKVEKPKKQAKSVPAADTSRWLTDFDTAWALAQSQGKPLVAIFTHHGCPECTRMDATLAQPGAASILDSAIKVRVEFTQNPATVQRFSVKLTPTFLVLSPVNGEVYREVGALTIERLFQLKPSIDSLVTASSSSPARNQETLVIRESSKKEPTNTSDDGTSRTVASL